MSPEKLFAKLGALIERRPTLVLCIALFLILPSLFGAASIKMETGLDTFVSKDSAVYRDFDAYYQSFAEPGTIVVLITADDITDFSVLSAMSRLEDTIGEVEDVTGVTSLAGVIEGAVKSYTGSAYIPHSEAEIEQIVGGLPPGLREGLMPDGQHAIMVVTMVVTESMEDMENVYYAIKEAVDWVDFPPGVDLAVTGDIAFGIQMEEAMSSGLETMMISACVLMMLILWVLLRHVRWRLLSLVTVMVGVIWTFGTMGLLGIPMTMVSMAVFPLLIGVGIDYAIQYHNRLDEEVKRGGSVEAAAINSIKSMGPAVGVAVLAAVLGYFALFTSPVPMITHFGIVNMIGLVLCYLAAILFLVPLLYKLYRRGERKGMVGEGEAVKSNAEGPTLIGRTLGRISVTAAKYSPIVLAVVVLLAAVGYVYDQKVGVSLEEKDYVPQDMPAFVEMMQWEHLIERTMPLTLLIRADDVTDPSLLDWMDDFGQYEVERRDEVSGASSIASLIKQGNQGRIPDTSAEVSLILDRIPEPQRDAYVQGRNLAVLNLDLTLTDPGEMRFLIEDVERDLGWKDIPPGVDVSITGQTVLFSSIWDAMTTGRLKMTLLGGILIFLGLLAIYRDWLKALIPVVPVALVTGLAGGAMYLLGIQYNPLTATLGALTIGLGAEYSILVMARYFEERGKGSLPFSAMETAASKVGVAIIASGLTTLGGFGALLLSGFPMLENFSIITVLIFFLIILTTFLVLPALLVPLDSWRSRRHGLSAGLTQPELL